MTAAWKWIRGNPVLVYSFLSAVLTSLAGVWAGIPVAPILGIAAAILGGGVGVRAVVTPETNAKEREKTAYEQGATDGVVATKQVI